MTEVPELVFTQLPRTHRDQERFPGPDHHFCFDSDGRKRGQLDMLVCRRRQF